jgi:CMP-N,N'-diacetyllegionaminic acid synthase
MIALIPARGGSKGVPYKNIKSLKGHPLLSFSIAACKLSKKISRVIVSTDDKKIAIAAKAYGAEVPFMRPNSLAQDGSTDCDYLKHFFDKVESEEVAIFRPTTPFRDPKEIDRIISIYENNKDACSSMRTMHEFPESPYKMLTMDKNNYCKGLFEDFEGIKEYTNLPRQNFPKVYHPNGYVDVVRKKVVENNKWKDSYGNKIYGCLTPYVLEIDEQYQFDMANSSMRRQDSILLEYLDDDTYKI